MTRPLFVALEGLDGTGKSTLARQLADALGAELLSTPPSELKPVRPAIDAAFGDGLAAQLFYASTVAHVSDRVRTLLAEGRSVVVDRYLASTLAYDALRTAHIPLDVLEARLVPADVTVYLETASAERRRRLAIRGGMTSVDAAGLTRESGLVAAYEAALGHFVCGRVMRIDSTESGPDALCASLVAELLPAAHAA